jgi:hypothetical protein
LYHKFIRYSNTEKEEIKKIMSTLKYLYQTYLNNADNNFNDKYIQFVKENKKFLNNKIHIISSDIHNAYDSIKQGLSIN